MRTVIFIAVVVLVFFSVPGVAAQTPTPTPLVVSGTEGDFVVIPELTYGDGGVIVALLFLAGIEFVKIGMEVAQWLRQ